MDKDKKIFSIVLICASIIALIWILLIKPPTRLSPATSWKYEVCDDYDCAVYSAMSADGNYIIAGESLSKKILLFKSSSSTPEDNYVLVENGYSISLAISSNGDYFVGRAGNYTSLFSKSSSSPIWSYNTGGGDELDISSDGNNIVVVGYKNIYFFNKTGPIPEWNYTTGSSVNSVAISSDGNYIVVGGNKNIYFFNKTGPIPEWNYTTGSSVESVAISSDGNYIVAGSSDNYIYFFNKTGPIPEWIYSTASSVYSVDISSDGYYIGGGNIEGTFFLFNRFNSTPLWNYEFETFVTHLAISSDGDYVVVGTEENEQGVIFFFKTSSSTPEWSYGGNEDYTNSLDISYDGRYVAASVESAGSVRYLLLFDRENPEIYTEQEIAQKYEAEFCIYILQIFIILMPVIFVVVFSLIIFQKQRNKRLENERALQEQSEKEERERMERERREAERKEAERKEKEAMDKLKQIVSISERISLSMMRDILELDEKTFNQRIIDWAAEFNFTIDGEYLNVNKETVDDFIDALDRQFAMWGKTEQERNGKI